MATKGYQIRMKDSRSNICLECVDNLSIENLLSGDSDVREISSSQYGGELCVVCGVNITGGSGASIDYPEAIAALLDKRFENRGERFGGVVPMIDSEREEKEITEGVKKSEAVRTQHDPVIVSLQAYESDIYQDVRQFLDRLSQMGSIRYTDEEITDENNEVRGYEITAFATK